MVRLFPVFQVACHELPALDDKLRLLDSPPGCPGPARLLSVNIGVSELRVKDAAASTAKVPPRSLLLHLRMPAPPLGPTKPPELQQ